MSKTGPETFRCAGCGNTKSCRSESNCLETNEHIFCNSCWNKLHTPAYDPAEDSGEWLIDKTMVKDSQVDVTYPVYRIFTPKKSVCYRTNIEKDANDLVVILNNHKPAYDPAAVEELIELVTTMTVFGINLTSCGVGDRTIFSSGKVDTKRCNYCIGCKANDIIAKLQGKT